VAVEIDQVHRFTLEEYHQLIESGGFDEDSRVELIEGVICDMSPKSREHEQAIRWLTEWLVINVDRARFEVGVQTALTLDPSEPEPDFAVIPRDAPRPYHPAKATLVIEIAVSSQRRDLISKPRIYARAGIPEYWVIDLDRHRAVAHRQPRADAYAQIDELGPDGRLQAQALSLPPLPLAELLAAAEG
jgi:Uma2 family endonuclease